MSSVQGVIGDRFWCFVDVCVEGKQFCDIERQRCKYCSDVGQNCFTNQQQKNCTQYCMGKWIELQEHIHRENVEFTTTAIIVLILLAILVCINITYLVDKLCFKHKLLHTLKRVLYCCRDGDSTVGNNQDQGYCKVSQIEEDRGEGEGGEGRRDTPRSSVDSTSVSVPNGGPSHTKEPDTATSVHNSAITHASVYATENRNNGNGHDHIEVHQANNHDDIRHNADGRRVNTASGQGNNPDNISNQNELHADSLSEQGNKRADKRKNVNASRHIRKRNADSAGRQDFKGRISEGDIGPGGKKVQRVDPTNGRDERHINRENANGSRDGRNANIDIARVTNGYDRNDVLGDMARPELESRASSVGDHGLQHYSQGVDTGYNSTQADLDHTDQKEIQPSPNVGICGTRRPAVAKIPEKDSNHAGNKNGKLLEPASLNPDELNSNTSPEPDQDDDETFK